MIIVNEQGEIVLDTLIKVDDTMMLMVKPGKKTALVELAKSKGPSIEEVQAKLI